MLPLRSVVTKKILTYFFANPDARLYVNELSRKLALDKRNCVKKIRELEQEGIITHETRGNLKLYSINQDYALYKEYKKIVMATFGVEGELRKLLAEVKNIKAAYIYGSYAHDAMDAHSDIDVLVVGSASAIAVQKRIHAFQAAIDREINVTVMDEADFERRSKAGDPFVTGVLKKAPIRLI